MATTTTITSGYNGEVARELAVKLATDNDIVQGGHAFVKDNIKHKYSIPRLAVEATVQDYKSTPVSADANGSISRTDQVLEPKDFMLYQEFQPRDFESDWLPFQPNGQLVWRQLPAEIQVAILSEVMKGMDVYMSKALIQGDMSAAVGTIGAPFNKFNGLLTRLLAQGGYIATPTPVALTGTNVYDELFRAWNLTPEAMKVPGTKIFCSKKTHKLMKQRVINETYKGQFFNQRIEADWFIDLPVVSLHGMPDDCFLITKGTASRDSNLWIGADVAFGADNFKVMPLQNNSEDWFLKAVFKYDTNLKFTQEAVLYKV